MKKRFYIFSVAAIVASASLMLMSSSIKKEGGYTPRSEENLSQSVNDVMNYHYQLRANQNTGKISYSDVAQAQKDVEYLIQSNPAKLSLNWTERGPDNFGGRVRAFLVDRNNSSLLFAGSVGGGLWKSTTNGMSWVQVPFSSSNMIDNNLTVSCIAQASNGTIYIGTGEGFAIPRGIGNDTTGFLGRGIWKSTDGGNSFSQLASTIPANFASIDAEWAYVNKVAVSPTTGWVYAATNKGLRLSTDGGGTWSNPIAGNDSISQEVITASDGGIAAVVGHTVYFSGNGSTFTSRYYNPKGASDLFNYRRMSLAFSSSGSDYLYILACNYAGTITGVFKSTNKGASWSRIAPVNGTNFNVFGGVGAGESTPGIGWYNQSIAVFPDNPDEIIIGGTDMWYWKPGSTWTLLTSGFEAMGSLYVHSCHHSYYISPNNSNFIYAATDGGIFASTTRGQSWIMRNKGLNITQYNNIGYSPEGWIIGGTQGNGTLILDGTGNTPKNARSADGAGSFAGAAVYSYINSHFNAISSYNNSFLRSADNGDSYQTFNASKVSQKGMFPPIVLWETLNNSNSTDYKDIINIEDYTIPAGSWMRVPSRNFGYPFWVVLPNNLNPHDTFRTKDVVQTKFFVGLQGSIWMTKDALVFSINSRWSQILKINQMEYPTAMEISPDGNYLYVGSKAGYVYRVSNVLLAEDSITADQGSNQYKCSVDTILQQANRVVTSIHIDPNNPQNIIVTYGNYGNNDYIFYTTNAVDASPTFVSVQGNLPKMPVYSSCILLVNSSTALVGTDLGLFATENLNSGSPTWDYAGMAYVPVSSIKQQTRYFPGVINYGNIYVGTQGRGAWESTKYYQSIDEEASNSILKSSLKVFPNPAADYTDITFSIEKASQVSIRLYNMNGQIAKESSFRAQSGNNKYSIDLNNINKGIYIVEIVAENMKATSKLIVK